MGSEGPGATRESRMNVCVCVPALSLRCALGDTLDCSPPVSFVSGISQARILECVVISSSRGSS